MMSSSDSISISLCNEVTGDGAQVEGGREFREGPSSSSDALSLTSMAMDLAIRLFVLP